MSYHAYYACYSALSCNTLSMTLQLGTRPQPATFAATEPSLMYALPTHNIYVSTQHHACCNSPTTAIPWSTGANIMPQNQLRAINVHTRPISTEHERICMHTIYYSSPKIKQLPNHRLHAQRRKPHAHPGASDAVQTTKIATVTH